MNEALSRGLHLLCGVGLVLYATTALAQEPLAKARALYDAANYEEALSVLTAVDAPEAQQYKALCMLALGRAQDAAGAVEQLITLQPTFEPSAEEVPPRFVALVADAKKKLLPAIARKAFNEARAQFKSGVREEALRKFDFVVTVASSPGFKDTPEAEDLRTLATGFIELAQAGKARQETATAPAPAEPAAALAPPLPPPAAAATAAAGSSLDEAPAPTSPSEVPSSADRAEAATPNPPASADVIQPVALRQTIPPVPSGISGLGGPTASVRVLIGVDGRVVSATMQQTSHPLYDRLVLQAAREWLYTPARLNGRPVPSEKVVTIQLR